MKQGKKINGINDIDTPEMAQMRATVIEQELSARSWKAYHDKMFYALEAEKLEPLYKEYQERAKAKLEKEREAFEKFRAALQEEIDKKNQADPEGDIKLEEAN
jgi:hypothetical protein